MNLSLTAHWHLIKDRKRGLAMLKAIAPRYVRISSLQKEVLSDSALKSLLHAGFRVIPIINADKAGRLSPKQWSTYVRQAINTMPVLG